jgi:hypothetical protein
MSEELPEGTHPSRLLSQLQLGSLMCCASVIATHLELFGSLLADEAPIAEVMNRSIGVHRAAS